MLAVVGPLFQAYESAGLPPVALTEASPLAPPKQDTGVDEGVTTIGFTVIVTLALPVQLYASVAVTVYVVVVVGEATGLAHVLQLSEPAGLQL